MRVFAAQADANHDGRMSRAEWQAQGLSMISFKMFDKGRGFVTLEDYTSHPAPPGIDLNGDGILTVEEFKEFDGNWHRKCARALRRPRMDCETVPRR